MNDQEDQVHVWFGVYEFGDDPGAVTLGLGFEPTRFWVKGDPDGRGAIRTHDRWEFKSPLPASGFEEQLDALLSRLEPHTDAIRDTAVSFPCRIGVAAYYQREFNPGLEVSADAIHRLAKLGLGVDFDLYFLGEDAEPNAEGA